MVKNMFEDMSVYDQEKPTITITQERHTKKDQRALESTLRQAYGDRVDKPNQANLLGSKTLKSDKTDRRPHQDRQKHQQSGALKKGQKAAEMEVEIGDKNGMEVEEEGNVAPQEPLVTLDEYYKQQGITIQ